jgi:hypothetical protein
MTVTRLQLSLFADPAEAETIEAVRQLLDPLQQDLTLRFRTIDLIEQHGSSPWTVLKQFTPVRPLP